jgi:hypothetical protein
MASSDQSDNDRGAFVDALGWALGWLAGAADTREVLLDLSVAARRSEGLSEQARLLITDAAALAITEADRGE